MWIFEFLYISIKSYQTWNVNVSITTSINTNMTKIYFDHEKIFLKRFLSQRQIFKFKLSHIWRTLCYIAACTMFASPPILPPSKALPAFGRPCQAVASWIREIHMGISEKYTWEHSRNTHDTWEVWQRKKKKVNSVLLLSDLKINLSSFFTLLYFLNCRWLTLMRRRSIKFWENVCNGLRLTSAHHTNTYQLITNKR